ncbi:glycosyltransferase family 4 protein [Gloeobacter kilaueensis]|uniref:Glycosyl transferase group 1 n=1 Tax=Gloeobacter kilaueensis (strain ATCC BAA-2537 / CCAP 1431/1 / ULC 316 / JS1) TaxID=1183438 RepID=U5QCH5_GLOK1|nr:glycosyltransferase family 1 protein [Gloeobacter kilaueensis]AGY56538.1 glycosyl transferase group 1 [Gloeobacter kilaueensis JS1]
MVRAHLCINLAFLPEKPTGLGTYALNLLAHLDWGDLVTLFSPRAVEPYPCCAVPAFLASDGGRWGHLARLGWQQTRLPALYRALKADLLFSPLPESPLSAQCRSVVTVHDLIPLRFPGPFPSLLTRYFQYYVPRVLERAEHILCDSKATASDIIRFYGISAHKITPIALAHDAAHFYPRGLDQGNYFLYVGRQDRHKNLARMIEAFARLRADDYEFWIAGPQDLRQRPPLVAQIDRLGLQRRVRFLDYVPYAQLPALVESAQALLFPTLWEGFGLPVLEAMACGTPVITSNLASLTEIATGAALLVDPYRVEAIADAMQRILTEPGLRTELRERGLVRATQFSWEHTAWQTGELLARFV